MEENIRYTYRSRPLDMILSPSFVHYASKSGVIDFFKELNPINPRFPSEVGNVSRDSTDLQNQIKSRGSLVSDIADEEWDNFEVHGVLDSPLLQNTDIHLIDRSVGNSTLGSFRNDSSYHTITKLGTKRTLDIMIGSKDTSDVLRHVQKKKNISELKLINDGHHLSSITPSNKNRPPKLTNVPHPQYSFSQGLTNRYPLPPGDKNPTHVDSASSHFFHFNRTKPNPAITPVVPSSQMTTIERPSEMSGAQTPIIDLSFRSVVSRDTHTSNATRSQNLISSFSSLQKSDVVSGPRSDESLARLSALSVQTRLSLQSLRKGYEVTTQAQQNEPTCKKRLNKSDTPGFLNPNCSGLSSTQWAQESLGGTNFLVARAASAASVLQSHPTPGIGLGSAIRSWIRIKAPNSEIVANESSLSYQCDDSSPGPLLPFAEMQADASLFSTASMLKVCATSVGDWSYVANVMKMLPLFLLGCQQIEKPKEFLFGCSEPIPSESVNHYVSTMTWTTIGGQGHPDDVLGAAFLIRIRNSAIRDFLKHLWKEFTCTLPKNSMFPHEVDINALFDDTSWIPHIHNSAQHGNLNEADLRKTFLPLLRPCIQSGYSTCFVYLPLLADTALHFLQGARTRQSSSSGTSDSRLLSQKDRWLLLRRILALPGIPKICLNAKNLCYPLLRSPIFQSSDGNTHYPSDLCDVMTATWLLSPDSVAMFKGFTPATPLGWHPVGDPECTPVHPSPIRNWSDSLPTPLYHVPESSVSPVLRDYVNTQQPNGQHTNPVSFPSSTSYVSDAKKKQAVVEMNQFLAKNMNPERPTNAPSIVQKIQSDRVILLENMAKEYDSVIERVSYYLNTVYTQGNNVSNPNPKGSSSLPDCVGHLVLLQYYGDVVLASLFLRNLHWVFFTQEVPLTLPLVEMETNGVGLDNVLLSNMEKQVQTMLGPIENEIRRYAGPIYGPDLNINSPKQVSFLLYEHLKLSPVVKQTNIYNKNLPTKGGRSLSTDTATLALLADQHPVCALIVEYRKLSKMDQSFLSSLQKIAVPSGSPSLSSTQHAPMSKSSPIDQGRMQIHPQLHAFRTGTGRLSCSHPNLQTLPSNLGTVEVGEDSVDGKAIRKAILPVTPGHILVSADYGQIEVRLIASLAGESRLISEFVDFSNASRRMRRRSRNTARKPASVMARPDPSQPMTQTPIQTQTQMDLDEDAADKVKFDIYNRVGGNIFGCAPENVSPQQRQMAKVFLLGLQYGMGVNEAARKVNLSRQETQKHLRSLQKAYPRLHYFLNFSAAFATKYCHVLTVTGRRRLLSESRHADTARSTYATRQAVNTIIQGTAADIMKQALILIQEGIKKYNDSLYRSPYDPLLLGECSVTGLASLQDNYLQPIRLDKPIPRIPAKMLLQIHDEVVLECEQTQSIVDEVCAGIERIMTILAPQRVEKIWEKILDPLSERYSSFISNSSTNSSPMKPEKAPHPYDMDRIKLLGEVRRFQVPFDVTIEVGPTFGDLTVWDGN